MKARKRKINRIEICFDHEEQSLPPDLIEHWLFGYVSGLIHRWGLDKHCTPDVCISPYHGHIPGVSEALRTGNTPTEFLAFVVSRAEIIGLDAKEMGEIVSRPFKAGATAGVVIAGHVKEPCD